MGLEVEHSSGNVQSTATTPSSAASGGPKVSMFVKKSGFVIPKNKLSGSLVPIFRGTKRGDGDLVNNDTSNQVQRKTKWGPDLTLDTTTRRGRASAYQIRINQISQQLTLGALELEGNEDLQAAPDHQLSKEELELLELEKREIIGELLKLNPTYKAPADYKPLLKEAKVPVPIKEHPGYDYIGLVFGPASDTLKRLEKETGAKIQVYGSKTDTGVKVEFTPTDGKDVENAYKDLYLHVSADTFEKVDAAMALIELLVTPVSVNPASVSTATAVSSDAANPTHLSQSTSSSVIPPVINQGMAQAFSIPVPSPQGQYPQFPQSWFPAGPAQPPPYPQAGLISPAGSTPSLASSSVQGSSVPYNPSNMPSLLGVRPIVATNFNQVMQNYSTAPSPAQPPLAKQPLYAQQAPPQGQNGAPRNANGPILQPPHAQASLSAPPHNVRPVISLPAQPTSESSRWLPPPMGPSASQGPTHNMQMTPPVPSLGLNFVSGVPPVSYPNMISPLSGGSQSAGPAAGQQPHGGFSSVFPSAASESTPSALQPSQIGPQQHAMPQAPIRAPPPNAVPGPAPRPFPVQSSGSHPQGPQPGIPNSFPGNAPNFDANSSMAAPRPQQSSSGDFTFQPHRPPPHPNQVWPSNQPPQHSLRPPVQAGHGPLGPQPLFRPLLHNPPAQGFARPQASHQGNQSRAQIPPNFSGPPPIPMIPPRHPALQGSNAAASAMQPRNFVPPHPINNSPGPFMPRPGNHIQESQLPGSARPQRFPPPHQHFGNYPAGGFSRPLGGPQQVYDPFSPTAAPFNPQMGGGNTSRPHSENDPEYEDLMASVGVK